MLKPATGDKTESQDGSRETVASCQCSCTGSD